MEVQGRRQPRHLSDSPGSILEDLPPDLTKISGRLTTFAQKSKTEIPFKFPSNRHRSGANPPAIKSVLRNICRNISSSFDHGLSLPGRTRRGSSVGGSVFVPPPSPKLKRKHWKPHGINIHFSMVFAFFNKIIQLRNSQRHDCLRPTWFFSMRWFVFASHQ